MDGELLMILSSAAAQPKHSSLITSLILYLPSQTCRERRPPAAAVLGLFLVPRPERVELVPPSSRVPGMVSQHDGPVGASHVGW